MMQLEITKRASAYHDLAVRRDDGSVESLKVPEQGIIPHDLVHYGVEAVLTHRGFLAMVAAGQPMAYETIGGDREEAIERLVEAFQAEMWTDSFSIEAVLEGYRLGCEARGHPLIAVTQADILAIREQLSELTQRWRALGIGERLVLDL